MAEFGLLSTGFVPKRLPDIKADFEADVQTMFGNDVNLTPSSVFGQLIGIYSKHLADLWELAEIIYNNQTVAGAEGISLDHILQLVGLTRLPAQQSTVSVVCYGDIGTPITVNDSIVSVSETHERFKCAVTKLISDTNIVDCTIKVLLDAVTYTVTIGTTVITTSGGSTPIANVAQIVADINAAQEFMEAIDNGDATFRLKSHDLVSGYLVILASATPTDAIEFTKIGTPVPFISDLYGAIAAPSNTLTTIETAVSGWDRANNLSAASEGRGVETDAEARIRREQSFSVIGAGSVEAIRARLLQEVDGVTAVAVFENVLDIEVDGRPPHSFEAVVDGGDAVDIAEKIWEVKPAGIATFGTINGGAGIEIQDSMNQPQFIKFSLPASKDVYVKVALTYYSEEQFPTDGFALIAQAIADFGNTLPLGKDLIIQRFYDPIFTVSGLASAAITWAIVPEDDPPPAPGDYVNTNIAIGATSIAKFATGRIFIS
jgi:uncharacterized phage protein gp47/JayE